MAYDNSNSGVMFRNTKRGDNPKAPNLKGTGHVTINGVDYELDLAAWTREGPRAGKFLSLSIKLKGDGSNTNQLVAQPAQAQRQHTERHRPEEDEEDSIPF